MKLDPVKGGLQRKSVARVENLVFGNVGCIFSELTMKLTYHELREHTKTTEDKEGGWQLSGGSLLLLFEDCIF